MKRYILLTTLILTIFILSACQQDRGTSSSAAVNATLDLSSYSSVTDVPSAAETDVLSTGMQDEVQSVLRDEYSTIVGTATNDAIDYMFGSHDLYDIIQTLGEPEKKEVHEHFERWYFNDGVEIDVESMNDYLVLVNYIFIGSDSDMQISDEIGIGCTYEQVTDAYKDLINPELTNEDMIVIGDKYGGICLVMESGKVKTIYIETGSATQEYFGEFQADRG
jgi:hypothetical protein